MSARDRYETDAEVAAFYEGKAAAIEVMDDLREVRKIACALIPLNPDEAMIDVADMAWTLWRAIKAGQEGQP